MIVARSFLNSKQAIDQPKISEIVEPPEEIVVHLPKTLAIAPPSQDIDSQIFLEKNEALLTQVEQILKKMTEYEKTVEELNKIKNALAAALHDEALLKQALETTQLKLEKAQNLAKTEENVHQAAIAALEQEKEAICQKLHIAEAKSLLLSETQEKLSDREKEIQQHQITIKRLQSKQQKAQHTIADLKKTHTLWPQEIKNLFIKTYTEMKASEEAEEASKEGQLAQPMNIDPETLQNIIQNALRSILETEKISFKEKAASDEVDMKEFRDFFIEAQQTTQTQNQKAHDFLQQIFDELEKIAQSLVAKDQESNELEASKKLSLSDLATQPLDLPLESIQEMILLTLDADFKAKETLIASNHDTLNQAVTLLTNMLKDNQSTTYASLQHVLKQCESIAHIVSATSHLLQKPKTAEQKSEMDEYTHPSPLSIKEMQDNIAQMVKDIHDVKDASSETKAALVKVEHTSRSLMQTLENAQGQNQNFLTSMFIKLYTELKHIIEAPQHIEGSETPEKAPQIDQAMVPLALTLNAIQEKIEKTLTEVRDINLASSETKAALAKAQHDNQVLLQKLKKRAFYQINGTPQKIGEKIETPIKRLFKHPRIGSHKKGNETAGNESTYINPITLDPGTSQSNLAENESVASDQVFPYHQESAEENNVVISSDPSEDHLHVDSSSTSSKKKKQTIPKSRRNTGIDLKNIIVCTPGKRTARNRGSSQITK